MARHSSALAAWVASKHPRGAQGRFVSPSAYGTEGAQARTSSIVHAAGAKAESYWEGLGRPTRTARLRSAAIRSHNKKLAKKVINRPQGGNRVGAHDAAMQKVQRILGTYQKRGDATFIIPEHLRGKWAKFRPDKTGG